MPRPRRGIPFPSSYLGVGPALSAWVALAVVLGGFASGPGPQSLPLPPGTSDPLPGPLGTHPPGGTGVPACTPPLSAAVERSLTGAWGVVSDGAETRRVARILRLIVSTSPELRQQHPAWRAAVLACATPNAYATSSGLVAVTSGMCALCPSDDALAFVLGHEVAHERLGHSRACEAGLLLAWLAAGEVGGEWPSPVMPTEWEAEADLAALDFVRAAGYEPALALAEILARVPVSPERRDALANLARGGGHGPARDQRADQ